MSKNVYQRIIDIRKAISYIQKDKKVESYMAVTHDGVTRETRDLFIEHGVLITPPSLVSSAVKDTGTTTSRGTPFIRYEANYKFLVVNVDDPADRFDFNIEAHALDHGDKAPGKALSYAKKYAILKLLEIESGEEEEAREEQHKPKAFKSVAKDTWDNLPQASRKKLADHSTVLVDFFNEGEDQRAYEYYEEIKAQLDNDEQIGLWSRLDSTQRSTIKKLGQANKEAEAVRKGAH